MLWLAIVLPELPLQVFTRAMSSPQPLAVASPPPRAQLIAANAPARALGIVPGLRPASALSLLPVLSLRARAPARERAALEEIALWAARFTPRISLAPPDAVLLEVSTTLRLFGGTHRIAHELEQALRTLGFEARLACAPTPLAAHWFARSAAGRLVDADDEQEDWLRHLDELPASVLADSGCDAATCELLAGLGMQTLAQVQALPAAGLARRQAQAVSEALARARGTLADLRPWFAPPQGFDHALTLPAPTHHAEALHFAARRLFASLAAWLQARHAALDACTLSLEYEHEPTTVLELLFGQPSADAQRFALIARERLASLPLPAEVCALRVRADRTMQASTPSGDLFGDTGQEAADAFLLLARLRARLGDSGVIRLGTRPEHRPEAALQVHVPDRAHSAREPVPAYRATAHLPPAAHARERPLWLLPVPRPILAERFTLLGCAERIETGWWDGQPVRRDYYRARDPGHVLCWIFSDLDRGGRWFLHGYFA